MVLTFFWGGGGGGGRGGGGLQGLRVQNREDEKGWSQPDPMSRSIISLEIMLGVLLFCLQNA